jgi:hypothetical protein
MARTFKSLLNGKHKLDVKFKEHEKLLVQHPGMYQLTLILGTFGKLVPIQYTLGSIKVDYPIMSAEEMNKWTLNELEEYAHEYEEFLSKPELVHVFKQDQAMPPVATSQLFTLLCLSPWLVLAALWGYLGVNLNRLNSYMQYTSGLSFVLTLVGIMVLYYYYWTHLKIFDMLFYLMLLSTNAAFTGRKALSDLATRRLKE